MTKPTPMFKLVAMRGHVIYETLDQNKPYAILQDRLNKSKHLYRTYTLRIVKL